MSKIAPAVRFPIAAAAPGPPEPNELFIPEKLGVPITNQLDFDGDTVVLGLSQNFPGFTAFEATGLPPGFIISPTTGQISGTFSADASQEGPGFNGIYPVEVTGSGSGSEPVTFPFEWTALNNPPISSGIPDQVSQDGGVINETFGTFFSDGGNDTDILTFSITGTLPPGLSLVDTELGVISGILVPTASLGGVGGVYTISLVADDGQGGVTFDIFLWTIAPIDIGITDPPFLINPCSLIVFITAELEGAQDNPHVFLWEQINIPSSTPAGTDDVVTFDTSVTGITLGYVQPEIGSDKTFRFTIDKGTPNEVFAVYFISGLPIAFAKDVGISISFSGARIEDETDPILINARIFDPTMVSFEVTVDTSSLVNSCDLTPTISAEFTWPHARGSAIHDAYILGVIQTVVFQKFVGPGWVDVEIYTDMDVDIFFVPVIEPGAEYRICSNYGVGGFPAVEVQTFYTNFGEISMDAGSGALMNDFIPDIAPMGAGFSSFPPAAPILRITTVRKGVESLQGDGPVGSPVSIIIDLLRLITIKREVETNGSSFGMGGAIGTALVVQRLNGIIIGGG